MKWYQVNIEGSQPSIRVSPSTTILNRSDSDIGTIVIYGGKSNQASPTTLHGYTDLAFFNVGSGVNEEYAKPQNSASISKLNKLLGGANGNSNNNNNNKQTTTTTTTTTTCTNTTINQLSNLNLNSNSTGGSSFSSAPSTPRKTYSKLPLYNGISIYHWENCFNIEGESPGERESHSIVAINSGTHKGKVLLFGGFDNNIIHSDHGDGANKDINLSNDIFLLDSDSLFWLKVKATGTNPSPRHSPFLCQISNDTLLLFGGQLAHQQNLTDIHLLTLSASNTLKWTQPSTSSSEQTLKSKLSLNPVYKVCFANGYLWVIIGNPLFEIYRCEIGNLSPSTFSIYSSYAKWSQVQFNGNIPKSLDDQSLITSYNQFLIFLVANELYFFDTNSLDWTGLDVEGELPNKRKNHSISMLGTQLIILGGQCELPLSTILIKDIEIIDLKQYFTKFQNKK